LNKVAGRAVTRTGLELAFWNIVSWILGGLFGLWGGASFAKGALAPGIAWLFASVFFLPPAREIIKGAIKGRGKKPVFFAISFFQSCLESLLWSHGVFLEASGAAFLGIGIFYLDAVFASKGIALLVSAVVLLPPVIELHEARQGKKLGMGVRGALLVVLRLLLIAAYYVEFAKW
jgi:hypothetical protein